MQGWLEREGGKFSKKFEKRLFVAWPAEWKTMGQTGPRLFIFDDKAAVKPSKVLQLESVVVSDPLHDRPAQPRRRLVHHCPPQLNKASWWVITFPLGALG